MSKRLRKYVASFDYFDKSYIVLSSTSSSISIVSFATVIAASVGIASGSFSLAFFNAYMNYKEIVQNNTR